MKRKKKLPKYQLGNGSIDIKSPTTLWGWNQNANIDMLPPQNRKVSLCLISKILL